MIGLKRLLFLVIVMFILGVGTVQASDAIKIYLFDEPVDMNNPIIKDGTTLVPMRVLFEDLGAVVTWNDADKTIVASKGDTNITLQIGNVTANKNGQIITLEQPAQIIDDKTYVPLRFVAESFNQDVTWDKDNNAIHIGKALTAKDISKLAAPAVVYIESHTYSNEVFSGSGFIVDSSGIIVTNYHVIDNAESVYVKTIDGSVFVVTNVINYSPDMDIAVLQVSTNRKLPTVTLGDSDKVETGENVFAIGSPKSLENTISEGIVSNKNAFFLGQNQIQISVPITHGSSGGALINSRGDVIGITDAGLGEADLNFAIPINQYKKLILSKYSMTLEQVYNQQHVIFYTDGTYVGDKKNGQPNGIGALKWNNGNYYIGDFVNGNMQGKGIFTWSNGTIYSGDWVNNKKEGYGKTTDVNGDTYEGQYSNDLENRGGKITYSNGDIFIGQFVNGKINGTGTYYYANGRILQGIWVNGTYYQ